MAESWRYQNARVGWTRVVVIRRAADCAYMLRCWASGDGWSACVYEGIWPDPALIMPGSRSRHESRRAAQRKLLDWVRERAKA